MNQNPELDVLVIQTAGSVRAAAGCLKTLSYSTGTGALFKRGQQLYGQAYVDAVAAWLFVENDINYRTAVACELGRFEAAAGIAPLAQAAATSVVSASAEGPKEQTPTVDGQYRQMFESAVDTEYKLLAAQHNAEPDPARRAKIWRRMHELHQRP